jgi:hypothetical protein
MKGREHPISQPAVLNPAVATHTPQVGRRHKLGYFVTNLLPNSLSTTALNRPRHKQSARIKPSHGVPPEDQRSVSRRLWASTRLWTHHHSASGSSPICGCHDASRQWKLTTDHLLPRRNQSNVPAFYASPVRSHPQSHVSSAHNILHGILLLGKGIEVNHWHLPLFPLVSFKCSPKCIKKFPAPRVV